MNSSNISFDIKRLPSFTSLDLDYINSEEDTFYEHFIKDVEILEQWRKRGKQVKDDATRGTIECSSVKSDLQSELSSTFTDIISKGDCHSCLDESTTRKEVKAESANYGSACSSKKDFMDDFCFMYSDDFPASPIPNISCRTNKDTSGDDLSACKREMESNGQSPLHLRSPDNREILSCLEVSGTFFQSATSPSNHCSSTALKGSTRCKAEKVLERGIKRGVADECHDEDYIERVKTKKGLRKRRRNEWTSEEIVLLLSCTKMLINYELKTIAQAVFELIKRDPGKCRGRAAEKKLKRMKIFDNWKTCDKSTVINNIDEILQKNESLSSKRKEELATEVAKAKKHAEASFFHVHDC